MVDLKRRTLGKATLAATASATTPRAVASAATATTAPSVPIPIAATLISIASIAQNDDLQISITKLGEELRADHGLFETAKQYVRGNLTGAFITEAFDVFQKIEELLRHANEAGFELLQLRQDPELIITAFEKAGSSCPDYYARDLSAFPDFMKELLGQDMFVSDAIKHVKETKRALLVQAVEHASTLIDPEARYSIHMTAKYNLPDDHPLQPMLREEARAYQAYLERDLETQAEEERNRARTRQREERLERYNNGVKHSAEFVLYEAAPTEGKSTYVAAGRPDQIFNIADLHATIQSLMHDGRSKRTAYALEDLRIGVDYILRQDGDRMARVIIENPELKRFFKDCRGNLRGVVRTRPKPEDFNV